ncbi:hypothetical protein EC957_001685 [Mortierella hygrophila]|uniref:Uncharacterized protein n=1 Tax=Mortierella hygrophila TaxID=979708 RepID=A0A9P6F5M5_9FUNG|nr:hypothetical protein EC957_001685 [Mortierella hygrophila]
MINITDFFPSHTQNLLTAQERMKIDSHAVGSSVLLLNLPFRYVLEYATNHIQRIDNTRDNNSNTTQAVLIVTNSRTTLQEAIRRERQVCKELYPCLASSASSSSSEEKIGIDPWTHLWPLPRPPPLEEYSTETRPSSPTTTPSISSSEHQQESEEVKTSFRSSLWARVQIRYAPTIRHVQSLFRCLHLDPGSTQGKTFGNDGGGGGDTYEYVVPSSSTATSGEVGGSVARPMPTLVILLGCFGHERSLEIQRFSMLDIVPAFANLGTLDKRKYSVEKEREKDESGSCARQRGADERMDHREGQVESFTHNSNDDGGEEEEDEKVLDAEELEELEYTEYIRLVANTMAEIKDSLTWLERTLGRKPELLIVEDTGQDHPDPSQLQASSRSATTQQEAMMIPTVRELWLQTALGFWVDAFIKTGSSSSSQVQQHQQHEPTRESYRLWLRTQESLSAAFTTTAMTESQPTWAEEGGRLSSPGAAATATAASMGAVLGVQWYFDSTGDRVHFQVVP